MTSRELESYAWIHVAAHLYEAKAHSRLYSLVGADFLIRKLSMVGSSTPGMRDIMLATKVAYDENNIPCLLKCSLLHAICGSYFELDEAGQNVLFEVLSGRYDQALANARMLSSPEARFATTLIIVESSLLAGQTVCAFRALDDALTANFNLRFALPVVADILALIARFDQDRALKLATKVEEGSRVLLLVEGAEKLLPEFLPRQRGFSTKP
jgi:hypothetical protein